MGVSERKARAFQRREQDLLEIASTLFSQKSIAEVTMENIAEQAEVSVGTLYQHFKSKNEIYARLFIEKDIERLERISQIDTGLPLPDQLLTLFRNYVAYYFENPTAYHILKSFEKNCALDKLSPDLLEKFKKQLNSLMEITERLLQKGIDEGAIVSAPNAYLSCAGWSIIHGSIELMLSQHFAGKITDWEEYFRFVEEVLIRGMVKIPAKTI